MVNSLSEIDQFSIHLCPFSLTSPNFYSYFVCVSKSNLKILSSILISILHLISHSFFLCNSLRLLINYLFSFFYSFIFFITFLLTYFFGISSYLITCVIFLFILMMELRIASEELQLLILYLFILYFDSFSYLVMMIGAFFFLLILNQLILVSIFCVCLFSCKIDEHLRTGDFFLRYFYCYPYQL